MEKDMYAVLEKNLNCLETKITDGIRVLVRKLNSETQKVEKYKEAIISSNEELSTSKRQITQLNESKVNLCKQLKGLDDRRSSVEKSQEELKKCLSRLRKEDEKMGKEYNKEKETLRKKIDLYRRKWQERYESRYAKKSFVQDYERAKQLLVEAKEQLQCSKSNFRECQADIFKAKCERGKRNAEESGFYPLQSFIIRISRVGAETGKLGKEEDNVLKEISYLQHNLDSVANANIGCSEEILHSRNEAEESALDKRAQSMMEHTSVNQRNERLTEIINRNQDHQPVQRRNQDFHPVQRTSSEFLGHHNMNQELQPSNRRPQSEHQIEPPGYRPLQPNNAHQWQQPHPHIAVQDSSNSKQTGQIIPEGKVRNRMERLKFQLYTPKFSPSPDEIQPKFTDGPRRANFRQLKSIQDNFQEPTVYRPLNDHDNSKRLPKLQQNTSTDTSVDNNLRPFSNSKQCSKPPVLKNNASATSFNRTIESQMQNSTNYESLRPESLSRVDDSTAEHRISNNRIFLGTSEKTVPLHQGIPPMAVQNSNIEANENNGFLDKSRGSSEFRDEIAKTIHFKGTEAQGNEPNVVQTSEKHIQEKTLSEDTELCNQAASNNNLQASYSRSSHFSHSKDYLTVERGFSKDSKRTYIDIDYEARYKHNESERKPNEEYISKKQEVLMNKQDFICQQGNSENIVQEKLRYNAKSSNEISYIDSSRISGTEAFNENKSFALPTKVYTKQALPESNVEFETYESTDKNFQKVLPVTLNNSNKESQKSIDSLNASMVHRDQNLQIPNYGKIDEVYQDQNKSHEKGMSTYKTQQNTSMRSSGNIAEEQKTSGTICNETLKILVDPMNIIADKSAKDSSNTGTGANKFAESLRKANTGYSKNAEKCSNEGSNAIYSKNYEKHTYNSSLSRVDQEVLPIQKESVMVDNLLPNSWNINTNETHEQPMDSSDGRNVDLENIPFDTNKGNVRTIEKTSSRVNLPNLIDNMVTNQSPPEQTGAIQKGQHMNTVAVVEQKEPQHGKMDTDNTDGEFMLQSVKANNFQMELPLLNKSKIPSQPFSGNVEKTHNSIQSMEIDAIIEEEHNVTKGKIQERTIHDDTTIQASDNLSGRNFSIEHQVTERKQLFKELNSSDDKEGSITGKASSPLDFKNEKVIATISPNNCNMNSNALGTSDNTKVKFGRDIGASAEKVPAQIENPPGKISCKVTETQSSQLQTQSQDYLTCDSNKTKRDDKQEPKLTVSLEDTERYATPEGSMPTQSSIKSSSGARYFSPWSHEPGVQGRLSPNSADVSQVQASNSSNSRDFKEDVNISSPFDLEKHMEVLEKLKKSPQFMYKTRPMYKPSVMLDIPSAVTEVKKTLPFDSMPFTNNPLEPVMDKNESEMQPEKSIPKESEFLSFAFEDYLNDSPPSNDGDGKEKSMFAFGGDSPKSVKSPPFFPMFAAASQENDEDNDNNKSGFAFNFGGAEGAKSPEGPSGFKFAF